jgi:dipeptidyl aminopeptidase/acylaminoacyl peptidase
VRSILLAVVAAAGTAALAIPALAVPFSAVCHPTPGLGSIVVRHGKAATIVDLATCGHRVVRVPGGHQAGLPSPDGRLVATVRVTGHGLATRDSIWVGSHRLFSRLEEGSTTGVLSPGPIRLLGWSDDSRWLVFTIDAGGSGSIAADGLIPRAISSSGGRAYTLPIMLTNEDYLAWCGGRLVFTAGEDRIATDRKRLMEASPPGWHARPLVRSPRRSWGSLACAPDVRSLVAQSQEQSTNPDFFATRWSLWRVALDGSQQRLTSPAPGYADESPRFSRDGRTLMFVRSRRGRGELYALRDGKVSGPILDVGTQPGFYGHRDWWQTLDWSLGVKPSI